MIGYEEGMKKSTTYNVECLCCIQMFFLQIKRLSIEAHIELQSCDLFFFLSPKFCIIECPDFYKLTRKCCFDNWTQTRFALLQLVMTGMNKLDYKSKWNVPQVKLLLNYVCIKQFWQIKRRIYFSSSSHSCASCVCVCHPCQAILLVER